MPQSKHPVVLVVDYTPPRELGCHHVDLSVATIERDDVSNTLSFSRWTDQGIRHRETIGGLYTRDLGWRVFRRNRQDSWDRERAPEPLHPFTSDDAGFYGVYCVDGRNLDDIAKTLRTLRKRLAAHNEKHGYAADFGESVLRIAAAVGADHVAIGWDLLTEATGRERPKHCAGERLHIYSRPGDARDDLAAVAKVDMPREKREEAVES